MDTASLRRDEVSETRCRTPRNGNAEVPRRGLKGDKDEVPDTSNGHVEWSSAAGDSSGPVVREKRHDPVRAEARGAPEVDQLDQERETDHGAPGPANELLGGQGGAARGQQVVDHQHPGVPHQGIDVEFQRIVPVLQPVGLAERFARELPRLAHRHEPTTQRGSQSTPEDESPGLDAHDLGDVQRGDPRGKRRDDPMP